jgi:WD40 repeat protein
LKVTEKGVRRIAFSPNGVVIATAGGDKNAAKVWDVSTGSLKFALPQGEGDTQMILWSPDGRIFVTSNDEAATLWNAESGELIQRLGERARYPIRFSTDGRTLATGSKNDVALLWEIEER